MTFQEDSEMSTYFWDGLSPFPIIDSAPMPALDIGIIAANDAPKCYWLTNTLLPGMENFVNGWRAIVPLGESGAVAVVFVPGRWYGDEGDTSGRADPEWRESPTAKVSIELGPDPDGMAHPGLEIDAAHRQLVSVLFDAEPMLAEIFNCPAETVRAEDFRALCATLAGFEVVQP